MNLVAGQGPDKLIKWEVDYPDNPEEYTPFLSTEMRIDETGAIHYRYYRKERNKGITLHNLSHHPTSIKEECVKNFYKTAERTSFGPTELAHSFNIVDDLLQKNGYKDPRTIAMAKSRTSKKKNKRENKSNSNTATLVLFSTPLLRRSMPHNESGNADLITEDQ